MDVRDISSTLHLALPGFLGAEKGHKCVYLLVYVGTTLCLGTVVHKGLWEFPTKDGIILVGDGYWVGGRFICMFSFVVCTCGDVL